MHATSYDQFITTVPAEKNSKADTEANKEAKKQFT
jgi:hypothetical protein